MTHVSALRAVGEEPKRHMPKRHIEYSIPMKIRPILLFCATLLACLSITPDARAQTATLATSLATSAQPQVKWSAVLHSNDARRGESAQIVVTAKIPKGWHLYSTTTPKGGPLPTVFKIAPNALLEQNAAPVQPRPKVKLDPGFDINVETFEGIVAFGLPVKIKANAPSKLKIAVQVRSMICSDTTCLPPQSETLSLIVVPAAGKARAERARPNTQIPPQPKNTASSTRTEPNDATIGAATNAANSDVNAASAKTTNSNSANSSAPTNTTKPSANANTANADSANDNATSANDNVTSANASANDNVNAANANATNAGSANAGSSNDIASRVRRAQNSGVFSFLLLSMTMGFSALLTPCVFPMIPLTVSVFSKKDDESKRDFRAPVAYCLGIVGTFTLLGLLVSAVFGAAGITRIAANPILNTAMAILFVVLALNLFGVFEIVVPSKVLNRVQPQNGARSGLAAPLLMGLAFTLTSFTCTVPFVGTLLVATSKGSAWWPFLGMLAFSSAFASPFFLLALFPQWLARLPKAGSWMVSLKATMGFLELAAALKFLSQADYVWQLGLLTRPVFLSVWSTLALVAGFYLLRWLRLPHESSAGKPGMARRVFGLGFCAVGLWLLAGIGGRSLGVLEAYPPPPFYGARVASVSLWHDNYEQAVARAKTEKKPLLINFTGYACSNCRVMETNVLPQPQVRRALESFVAVELYTDGEDAASRKNSQLQQAQFGTVALPLYVVVSPDGRELSRLEGLHQNPQAFVDFLERAHSSTRLATR